MVLWSQYLSNIGDFLNTTAAQAGIIMSLIFVVVLLVIVLVSTKGQGGFITIPITSFFGIIFFVYIGWFPVWTGSVISLLLVIFLGYIFSKTIGVT